MNASQSAVMLYGWRVRAGMACLRVKPCVAIYERFNKYIGTVFKDALQMAGLLFYGRPM